jgi:hypothetical protein
MIEIYNDWILVSSVGLMFSFLFIFEPYGWVMENLLPFKPFNCVLCFSFWCSLLLYAYLGVNPLYAIYTAFIAELSYRKLVNE